MSGKRRTRGAGEGSIYRRKDGRWAAAITVGYDERGRQRRRYLYGRTRRDVQERLAKALSDQQTGMLPTSTLLTVGQHLEGWLKDTVPHTTRPNTLEAYSVVVRKHLVPRIGKIKLNALTPAHIQALYAEKFAEGLASKYVRSVHGVLHRALEQAVKWGMIPRNPASAVTLPKLVGKKMAVLTAEQASRLLATAGADPFFAIYALAITCGLRLGELLGLTWDDVNLDEGYLHIRYQLQYVGKPVLTPPKSSKGRRRIALPPLAIDALRQHRVRQAKERRAAGPAWQDEWGLVFTTKIGTPVSPSNFRNRSFYPLLKKVGLPRIRFHDLRHTAATLMIQAGTPQNAVSQVLGHSSVGFTLDTYAHVLPAMEKDAATRMQKILDAAKDG